MLVLKKVARILAKEILVVLLSVWKAKHLSSLVWSVLAGFVPYLVYLVCMLESLHILTGSSSIWKILEVHRQVLLLHQVLVVRTMTM